ncbi:hypothetical protein KA005_80715 [bacterium]|nr:hypothetical protein [bacterium]
MTDIDLDKNYPKHCARYYGWLPASRTFQKQIKKTSLKYFTLCAKQAIDVFMLELEKVLVRDKNRKLPDVIICEKIPSCAVEIFKLVRPPLKEAILVGELEKILTFQETEETRGLSPDEDVRDHRLRRMLRIKGLSERIREYFPFDIINFDPYGNLLNPAQETNRLYQSLRKIFELQKRIDTFLLFVTTPIFDIHPDSESRLKSKFESNISSHTDIRTALQSSFGTITYHEIDENKRIAICFAKSVVISAAREEGWNHKHFGIFVYESPGRNKMLSSVVQFSKVPSAPDESAYIQDIVRVIQDMPQHHSYRNSLQNQEVKDHLDEIKKYRQNIRDEYRQRP